jgi:hypothetical protein
MVLQAPEVAPQRDEAEKRDSVNSHNISDAVPDRRGVVSLRFHGMDW